jgi:TolB-like protein
MNISNLCRLRHTSAEPKVGACDEDKPRQAAIPPRQPSIAVLPFQNMSGEHERKYFADGCITALSQFKSLVIARNPSFTYKGKSVDIKQGGHELAVRYVLERVESGPAASASPVN